MNLQRMARGATYVTFLAIAIGCGGGGGGSSSTPSPGSGGEAFLLGSNAIGNAGGFDLAMSPAGEGLAAWATLDFANSSNSFIWAARFDPISGAGPAVPIASDTNYVSLANPKIAVDEAGNAVAVWLRSSPYDGGRNTVWASLFAPQMGWAPPQVISGGLGSYQIRFVGFDASARALVVWRAGSELWTNTYTPGAGWVSPSVLKGLSPDAVLAHSGTGRILAAWVGPTLTGTGVLASEYTPASGWSASMAVAAVDPNGDAAVASASVTPEGAALVGWGWENGTEWCFWAARSATLPGWESPIRLSAQDVKPKSSLGLDLKGGFGLAVWRQTQSVLQPESEIWACRYDPAGGSWTPAEMISDGPQGPYAYPGAVSDSSGNAMVFWPRGSAQQLDDVIARRFAADLGWEAATPIDSPDAGYGASTPLAGADSAGRVLAIWSQQWGQNGVAMWYRYWS